MSLPPAPSKGDDQPRKKKASPTPSKAKQQPQQQATKAANAQTLSSSSSNASAQLVKKGAPPAQTNPATAATPTKKTKLSKAAKKKAAAAAAAAAANGSTTAAAPSSSSTTTSSTVKQQQQQHVQQRTLDSDSLKSRNHTLFLAPSALSSLPSWGRSRKDSAADSVAQRLHTEILEYAQYTRRTVEDMAVHIEVMIANVRSCVQSLWPRSTVETFGSYSTGIWLPSSDVDLVILGVVEANDTVVTVKNLRRLAKALEAQTWVHSLLLLDTAKIPVLKLVSADTRVPIDITFESSSTHSGLIARDLIKRYAEELPELYPLAVVFKQLLRERDLNDAYTGGLSSYSIVLMIVHFAQLWRHGERCFRAASIFASGAAPPSPAALAAEAARALADAEAAAASKNAQSSTPNEVGSPVELPPPPTSSYAAIVARSKSLKRSVSETTGASSTLSKETDASNSSNSSNASASGADSAQAPQRFSYAAVAAGIAKVSSSEDAKASAPAPPSSYAAAVAAAAGTKSSSAVLRTPLSSSKAVASSSSSSTVIASALANAAAAASASDAQLDAVSVTSSNADTEDSCSSSSSSSSSTAADSDDESVRRRQQATQAPAAQTCVCLGEHTLMLLEFFGIIFDYRKNGISIRDGGYIYRLAEHGSDVIGKPALVIEDPIHPDRNVSASSFAFSKVVAVFEDSYYALKYHRPSKFAPSALSCLLSASGHSSHSSKASSSSSSSNSTSALKR